MINPSLMARLRGSIFQTERRKGRNDNRIWLLRKLGWHFVELPLQSISAAGGRPGSVGLDAVFSNNDRGIDNMKIWCSEHCQGKWRYEPSGIFIFKSLVDATHFKLTWWN